MNTILTAFFYLIAILASPFVIIYTVCKTVSAEISLRYKPAEKVSNTTPQLPFPPPEILKIVFMGPAGMAVAQMRRGQGVDLHKAGSSSDEGPILYLRYSLNEVNTLEMIFNHATVAQISRSDL